MENDYSDILDNRNFEVEDRANYLAEGSDTVKIAVGYFYVSGFDLLKENLQDAEEIQLIIGRQTDAQTRDELVKGFREDLDKVEKNEETEQGVNRLYQLIHDDKVDVKIYTKSRFHPKMYLFNYENKKVSGSAIVGSSNLSPSGLTGNVELNVEKTDSPSIRYLNNWFDEIWEESDEFKEDLLKVIESSQFENSVTKPEEKPKDLVSPYQATKLYIYEQFQREIEEGTLLETIEGDYEEKLTEFQNDAVRSARYTLNKYNGVILSDSVGLGKTYIGAPLIQEYAHPQSKVLIIAPKRLHDMWKRMLDNEFPVNAKKRFMSFAELSRLEPKQIQEARDFDIVLIDEAHRLRNSNTQRYDNIQNLGRKNKKYILLTATPIQNSVHDLDSIIKIFADDDDFQIDLLEDPSDLFKMYNKLSQLDEISSEQEAKLDTVRKEIEKIMREVLISRTRDYIQDNYDDVKIGDREIKTPDRVPHLVTGADSDMEELYSKIIEKVAGKDSEDDGGLNLPYVGIGRYGELDGAEDFELEYRNASALLVILLFKRLESSLRAFESSVDSLIEREKAIRKIAKGEFDRSRDRENVLHYFDSMDDEGVLDDADIDEIQDAVDRLGQDQRMEIVQDVSEDLTALENIKELAQDYLTEEEQDAKVEKLRDLIKNDLADEKVLIFTQYIPTAEYLFEKLTDNSTGTTGRIEGDGRKVGYLHGDNFNKKLVEQFSPESNERELGLGDDEIDVLIATDVLSVGQNLQDSRVVVNFDLHWNPMNMEQRIGRIDRITTKHDELLIYNFIPTKELEDSLGILDRIRRKIKDISSTLGHEAPILEETEELVEKNMIIYDKLEEGEFSEDGGFPAVTSKYDRFRNTVREFCEENDIDIEELQHTENITDKERIAFHTVNDAEADSYLGLTNLQYTSNREETKALIVKGKMGASQVEIGGKTALFDIPKLEDDELEIFRMIKSTETEKQVGDVEKIREIQEEVLKPESNWNNQLLNLDSTPSKEINKIKQFCETAGEEERYPEESQEKAEEILETIEQYEISDYYENELYKTYKRRNTLGGKKVIDIIHSRLMDFELSEPEKVDEVNVNLTESLNL